MGIDMLLGLLVGALVATFLLAGAYVRLRKKITENRGIIRTINDPIVIVDRQSRVVAVHNIDSCVGFSVLTLGSSLRDLDYTESTELLINAINGIAVGSQDKVELFINSGDSTARYHVNIFCSAVDRVVCHFCSIDKLWSDRKLIEHDMSIAGPILDAFPFPVMIKDANDGFTYIHWNKQCEQLTGWSRNNVLGKTDIELYGQHRGGLLRSVDIQISRDGRHYLNQEVFATDDGVQHDTIVSKDLISTDYKKWILTTRWEITDLINVQKSLELTNKQLSMIFSAGNMIPWVWDVPSGVINLGPGDFYTQSEEDIVPNTSATIEFVLEHTHPDDYPKAASVAQQLCNGEIETENFVMRYNRNNMFNTYYNVFIVVAQNDPVTGAPLKIIGALQDVTAQKNYEQQIMVANKQIEQANCTNQLILDNADIGLIYLTPDYVVQWENLSKYSNHPMALGYKTGVCCYRHMYNRDEPCQGCVMKTAISEKRTVAKEANFGATIAQIAATPLYESDGSCTGVVLKVKDITSDKHREADLRAAKESAEKSDELKSAFLANMSHEIRTPLNSILGFSELLSMTDDPQEKEEYLKIINTNNELLLQLINDILDLSKIEANTLEFVYTDVVLDDLFMDLERSFTYKEAIINSSVKIIFEKLEHGSTLYTDRNRLQQVVSNFITNALKFTEKGSVTFGYELRLGEIYFYVTDTGTGIPQDKLNDIFKRFTKLDNFKTGTGLGLTICQTIIHKLKGQIGVVSQVGQGSTFWFTIPNKS